MSTVEKTDLYMHARLIADTVENGHIVEAHEVDDYDCEYTEGDILSAHDYLKDALDFRYLVDGHDDVLQVQILVAFGGPNIWIHLWRDGSGEVCAFWWGDHATAPINGDAMGLFQACEEFRGR